LAAVVGNLAKEQNNAMRDGIARQLMLLDRYLTFWLLVGTTAGVGAARVMSRLASFPNDLNFGEA